MTIYKHMLFATDLGEFSAEIGRKASALAKSLGAEITLMHAIEPIPAYGYPTYSDLESPFIDRAKQEMAKLGENLGIPINKQRISLGSVKVKVGETAKELNIDLIIVGSHSKHGLERLLGSNANAIIHAAPCDVLALRCGDA